MKPKKKKPRTEITKRRISEALTGEKIGGRESMINPKDGEELRRLVSKGDHFKHQELIDWWRNISSMD